MKTLIAVLIIFFGLGCYATGLRHGAEQQAEIPPRVIVQPRPAIEMSQTECLRMCVARTRSNRTKPSGVPM